MESWMDMGLLRPRVGAGAVHCCASIPAFISSLFRASAKLVVVRGSCFAIVHAARHQFSLTMFWVRLVLLS